MKPLTEDTLEGEIQKLMSDLDREARQNWVMALARRMANGEEIPDEDLMVYHTLNDDEKMHVFCFMLGVMASFMEPPELVGAFV